MDQATAPRARGRPDVSRSVHLPRRIPLVVCGDLSPQAARHRRGVSRPVCAGAPGRRRARGALESRRRHSGGAPAWRGRSPRAGTSAWRGRRRRRRGYGSAPKRVFTPGRRWPIACGGRRRLQQRPAASWRSCTARSRAATPARRPTPVPCSVSSSRASSPAGCSSSASARAPASGCVAGAIVCASSRIRRPAHFR